MQKLSVTGLAQDWQLFLPISGILQGKMLGVLECEDENGLLGYSGQQDGPEFEGKDSEKSANNSLMTV